MQPLGLSHAFSSLRENRLDTWAIFKNWVEKLRKKRTDLQFGIYASIVILHSFVIFFDLFHFVT